MGVDRDVSTAYCWSSSGDDVDWLCLIISSTVAVCDWCISILAVVVNDWRISILVVLTRSCSLTSPLWYRSTVVVFDHRHPPFWNINSAIPIDIVRVKSNLDLWHLCCFGAFSVNQIVSYVFVLRNASC